MPNKTQDEQRAADLVSVPNVVEKHFLQAREIAQNAGLTLANPDPDGPPISSIAWPKNPTIQSQSPAPGSVSYRQGSCQLSTTDIGRPCP